MNERQRRSAEHYLFKLIETYYQLGKRKGETSTDTMKSNVELYVKELDKLINRMPWVHQHQKRDWTFIYLELT